MKLFRSVVCGLLLVSAGCGESQPTGEIIAVVPASGILTLDGKPLEYYQVSVFPENNRPAVGVTDTEGKFKLGTNAPNDGAVVGHHRVAVTFQGPPSTNPDEEIMEFTPPPEPTEKIRDEYASPETSGLTIDVPESGTAEIVIDLQ